MRINSVPDVKCFFNNKNVLRAQSMVWHFVRHFVFLTALTQMCLVTYLNNYVVTSIIVRSNFIRMYQNN